MSEKLPPLPRTKFRDIFHQGCYLGDMYSADQMRAYAAAAVAAAVPPGWKLVPVEPTPEMVHAAFDALPAWELEGNIRRHYRAMLAAAPEVPR